MQRRQFLSWTAMATASYATAGLGVAERAADFDFIFITDTHIERELNAAVGCAMCFKKARSIPADFVIQGGDHTFDLAAADRSRAMALFDLYTETEQKLGLKVYHTLGNHDVFGIVPQSGVATSDPLYAKKLYQDRLGATYYSFDHKGYHFIVLDSIQPTADRSWEAAIDVRQLEWLKKDLAGVPARVPVILAVHVPLVTGATSYGPPYAGKYNQHSVDNAYEVLALFSSHRVIAVLQGHWHMNEVVTFRGTPYVTCGAVSGNWWHGTRWGTPEGFTVVSLRNGRITWRYETYGFQSVDPNNK